MSSFLTLTLQSRTRQCSWKEPFQCLPTWWKVVSFYFLKKIFNFIKYFWWWEEAEKCVVTPPCSGTVWYGEARPDYQQWVRSEQGRRKAGRTSRRYCSPPEVVIGSFYFTVLHSQSVSLLHLVSPGLDNVVGKSSPDPAAPTELLHRLQDSPGLQRSHYLSAYLTLLVELGQLGSDKLRHNVTLTFFCNECLISPKSLKKTTVLWSFMSLLCT